MTRSQSQAIRKSRPAQCRAGFFCFPYSFAVLQPVCAALVLSLRRKEEKGVEKRLATYRTIVVALLVLLAMALPHHHHEGGVACYAVERCADDGHLNDEHTACGHTARPDAQECAFKSALYLFQSPRPAVCTPVLHPQTFALGGGFCQLPAPAYYYIMRPRGARGKIAPALSGHYVSQPRRGPPFA